METVKIEEGARYLIVVETPQPISVRSADQIQRTVMEYVTKWWDSGDKFGVLVSDAGAHIHLTRVEG